MRWRPVQPVEQIARFGRRAEREHRSVVSIPRANHRLAEALPVALGSDHGVGAPGAVDLEAFQ